MNKRWLHHVLAVTLLCGLQTVLFVSPALAHGRGSDASNYRSTITDTAGLDTVQWRILNADEYLQVTNVSGTELMVEDYAGNPYLRVGPDGVFRNRNSQATYINADRFGQTAVPVDIQVGGPPDWEQISDAQTYAWHDHRIHWMAQARPPGVQTSPGTEQVVLDWSVPFRLDGTPHALTGELVWVPGANPWVWLLPALIVVSLPVAYGLSATKPDSDLRWPGLAIPAGATLLVLSVLNVIHLVDDLFATPIGVGERLVSAVQTFFFILIGVFGAVRAMQGKDGAFTALGVGAASLFIGQGLLYLSVLSASQSASLFPGWVTRAVIALSLAQIIPLGAAAIRGTRALLPDFDEGLDELALE